MPVEKTTEDFPGDLPDFGTPSTAPPSEMPSGAPVGAQPVTEATFEAEESPKLPEFNPKHQQALEGLLYLGRLERRFHWANHVFVIKTLDSEDRLRAGLLAKPWIGSSEEARAWVIAQVALATIKIDGKQTVLPLDQEEDISEAKFAWAQKQYPWTIDAIFSHLLELESEAQAVIESMGKASGSEAP